MPAEITPDHLFRKLRDNLDFDPSWPEGNWPVRWDFRPEGFEIAVGAILTQNTRWENVETVLGRLVGASLTDPAAILDAGTELQEVVRPAGFYRRKSSTLRRLAELWHRTGGRVPERSELLGVAGVGPETADAVCLYAAGRPEFVADAYTRRLVVRLGLLASSEATYEGVKAWFEERQEADVERFRAFHALIVQHGKHICRRRPACERCPLRRECPVAENAGGLDG